MPRARHLPRTFSIRRATAEDAAAFALMHSDPQVLAMTLQMPFPSEAMWRKRMEEGDPQDLVLIAHVGKEAVGSAGLHRTGKATRRAHVRALGISVRAAWQRRGIGTALMKALVDYADRWANASRLELTVYTDNRAAIALYRKFGFQIEGTHPQYAFRAGTFVDAHTMGRVTNPAAVKATSIKTT